jgi:hypothetical protein
LTRYLVIDKFWINMTPVGPVSNLGKSWTLVSNANGPVLNIHCCDNIP